jgi:nucleotide-binding universal stress UspA family protein
MAKRILVPMDGSDRSEAVVPMVAALARDGGATVRLMRVYPVPERVVGDNGRTIAYADQQMDNLTAAGLDTLAHVGARLPDVPVERVVRFGETVEEIVHEAEAFGADVIALAASRRGGVRRALWPDVAERVATKATVPTLVIHGTAA